MLDVIFDQDDLAAVRAELRDVRLPPPSEFEQPGSVRDAARFLRLPVKVRGADGKLGRTKKLRRSRRQKGPPVEPLAELDAYYREDCEARIKHGHQPRTTLEFWADEILFLHWKWGPDFRLSVAREAAVRAWHQQVHKKVDTQLMPPGAGATARDAARASSDVDIRQLPPPTPQQAPPASSGKSLRDEPRSRRVLDDEAALDEIEALIARKYSEPAAINEVVPKAQRMRKTTKDKSVYARLRKNLELRRQSRA